MYKIIELGAFAQGSAEPRVRLLRKGLAKTASSEIQTFWDAIEKTDDAAYLWVIGVSAWEYYGCNNNGDAFSEADLQASHPSFVSNAHVFLHHVNKDPARSIGKPVYSWYNPDMHRVELVLQLDKARPGAAAQVARIKAGEPVFVSMGCKVAHDVCSICGNKAPTREQYCDHLRFNLKRILPDGRQVYALNPDPVFFDISIVRRPADPTAGALDKLASQSWAPEHGQCAAGSAALGEAAEDLCANRDAVRKLAELAKRMDGSIADIKGGPEAFARQLGERGFADFCYPALDGAQLCRMGLSPAGLALALVGLGAPLTFGDAAWMAGRHFHGDEYSDRHVSAMLGKLPDALELLADHPETVNTLSQAVLADYHGELDSPAAGTLTIRLLRPVAHARIALIRGLVPLTQLVKVGEAFGAPVQSEAGIMTSTLALLTRTLSRKGENFAQLTFSDEQGRKASTTPYHLRQAQAMNWPLQAALKGMGAAMALGALGAAVTEPTLLGKLLYSTVLALPAATLLSGAAGGPAAYNREGGEVPLSTLMEAWKQEKRGSLRLPRSASGSLRLGTMAGMAVPAALALDYAYNRWRYGPYAGQPQSRIGRGLNRAGRFVADNPILSVTAGGLLGARLGR